MDTPKVKRRPYSTPDHPPYAEMIQAAIRTLAEEDGSTEEDMDQYIKSEYHDLPWGHRNLLPHYIRKLIAAGELHTSPSGRLLISNHPVNVRGPTVAASSQGRTLPSEKSMANPMVEDALAGPSDDPPTLAQPSQFDEPVAAEAPPPEPLTTVCTPSGAPADQVPRPPPDEPVGAEVPPPVSVTTVSPPSAAPAAQVPPPNEPVSVEVPPIESVTMVSPPSAAPTIQVPPPLSDTAAAPPPPVSRGSAGSPSLPKRRGRPPKKQKPVVPDHLTALTTNDLETTTRTSPSDQMGHEVPPPAPTLTETVTLKTSNVRLRKRWRPPKKKPVMEDVPVQFSSQVPQSTTPEEQAIVKGNELMDLETPLASLRAAATLPKCRVRPPRKKQAVLDADVNAGEVVEPKSAVSPARDLGGSPVPKLRGRPPMKNMIAQDVLPEMETKEPEAETTAWTPVDKSSSSAVPMRRGRPPKKKLEVEEQAATNVDVVSEKEELLAPQATKTSSSNLPKRRKASKEAQTRRWCYS